MKVEQVIEKTIEQIKKGISDKLTIVLIGSQPSERTYYKGKLLSDINLTILNNLGILYRKRLKEISEKNSSPDLQINIFIASPQLIRNNFSIFSLELKKSGKLLNGNRKRIDKIKITEDTLPKWEGLRTLFTNYMYSSFDLKGIENTYRNAKIYLSIADAFLCFNKKYKVTYKEKRNEILKIDLPKDIREKIMISFDFKLNLISDASKLKKISDKNEAVELLLKYVDHFLKLYLNNDKSALENIKTIKSRFPVLIHRNNLFYVHCPVKYLPKVNILHFNPITMIECAITNDYKSLGKFFSNPPLNFPELTEIFMAYPSFIIKNDRQILRKRIKKLS
ncbi:hypothetical protein ACFLZX_00805 [Nanoarchaeota archaeon]